MTEGRKAGWASKLKPGPLLSSGSNLVFFFFNGIFHKHHQIFGMVPPERFPLPLPVSSPTLEIPRKEKKCLSCNPRFIFAPFSSACQSLTNQTLCFALFEGKKTISFLCFCYVKDTVGKSLKTSWHCCVESPENRQEETWKITFGYFGYEDRFETK